MLHCITNLHTRYYNIAQFVRRLGRLSQVGSGYVLQLHRAPATQSSSYVVRQLSKCSSYVEAAPQFHRTDLLRTPGSTILASLWDVTACLLPCRSCAAQQRWKCKSKVHTSNRRPQQTPFSPPKAAGGCCQPGPVPLLEDFSSQDAD